MPGTQTTGTALQEWANDNQPAENLIYKDGYWNQIIFVRDAITGVLAKSYTEYQEIQSKLQVISEHTSKSVRLPVFRIELPDGTAFIMRYNFHNWKVSVNSPKDVEADFMDLFDPEARIHDVYCEGFPKNMVYGPYSKNKRQFTLELAPGEHRVFTFFWILAHRALNKIE